eukprot:TRINITY_DN50548_c0_g1_i1.p1 TRINITY_DN50548_c0_g1~~TRINITY_DN50548_c0_g1_i1.p1  ORF type:complete len:146 (+),score=9.38 TRINITY_DN50548_c0_g1_i1:62-439(+)
MTITRFKADFPRLPHVEELKMILGPGHYEEPFWSHTSKDFFDVVLLKFPALKVIHIDARVQTLKEPPLVEVSKCFVAQGVHVKICSLNSSGGKPRGNISEIKDHLEKANIEITDSCAYSNTCHCW